MHLGWRFAEGLNFDGKGKLNLVAGGVTVAFLAQDLLFWLSFPSYQLN